MIRRGLVQPVVILAMAVATGCMKEKQIELEQVKIEPESAVKGQRESTTQTARIKLAFIDPLATVSPTSQALALASPNGPKAAAHLSSSTSPQPAAALVAVAEATPEVETPDYEMNTSMPVDFSGHFLVKAMHFEVRNLVLTMKMTVQCTRETSPTVHFVFVHVVKNGKAAFGLDNQPLVRQDRNLKRGEELELNFVTQTPTLFDPKIYDGLRFGVIRRVGAGDARMTVAKTPLTTEDHQTAVFWKFK